MRTSLAARSGHTALILSAFLAPATTVAQHIHPYKIFATGTDISPTTNGPDSIAAGKDSIWVSYTNGADSTGMGGSSTIVQYSRKGKIRHQYTIPGSVDGLKVEPETGLVWALQNQDGNSTLTLIDPKNGPGSPLHFAVSSSARGYDDVVFRGDKVFLSYTNPTMATDPTIQRLDNRTSPLQVTPVLTMGATGTNLATGQKNQPTTDSDPDSMKLTPSGDLMLSSAGDGQLIFVSHPGKPNQSVAFLTVLDPGSGMHVTELDDAIFATSEKGTFYLTDTNNNRVLAIEADDIPEGSLYACVGSLQEFGRIDTSTGFVTALVMSLDGPHGLVFMPKGNDDNQNDEGGDAQGH